MPRNPDRETTFRFKRFEVTNQKSAMKVGTDGVLLGAWVNAEGCATAIDIGCGTGLIALMLAQKGVSDVTGIEVDETSADEARLNVASSPWPGNVRIVTADFNRWWRDNGTKADLIVSNPPFFNEALQSPDARRASARHEESLPLGGLIEAIAHLLNPEGRAAIVLPASREGELNMLAASSRLFIGRLTRVATTPAKQPKRILAELRHAPCPTAIDSLTIHDGAGGYSDSYRRLTAEFYMNF